MSVAVFKAVADPTRRRILEQLRNGELAAGQVASRFPISGPSVSRHLSVLKAAGLVSERRQANRILYSLVPERLATTVGVFLATVCPEDEQSPARTKKKAKTPDRPSSKVKHKSLRPKASHVPGPGAAPGPGPGSGPGSGQRPGTGS